MERRHVAVRRLVEPEATDRADDLFGGPGEMRALCRALDWAATPLGAVETWPLSLRTIVATMLASRHPMFLWWGPALTQIYNDGYRPSLGQGGRHPRALGMSGPEFWTEVWDVIGPDVASVLAGGVATWHEDHLVPIERNGRIEDVYWTYSYSPAFDDAGRVGGVLVVCQETTARVAERSRLNGLLEAAPAVMAVYSGPTHVITYVNPMWERVVGKPAALGQPVRDVFPEMAATGIFDALDRVYETGEPFAVTEVALPIQRQPGGPIEESYWSLVWMPLPGAFPVGTTGLGGDVLIHAIDVTAQVVARREVEAARAEAEAANRAKGEFLAIMSHELRTPLNAIGGYAELLEMGVRGPVTDAQRADLERIQQSQRHLLGLINQVLNYTRVETGIVRYDIGDVPVRDAIAAAEALVTPQVRKRGLHYVLERCDPDLLVRADADKLQQILLNLLGNGIKFTDAGGEIRVACLSRGATVVVSVADTGVGIAPDKMASIFDPFVQVDQRLKRTNEGVGLGLAISRDLARGMGGDISAESTLGVGSRFVLTLPRAT